MKKYIKVFMKEPSEEQGKLIVIPNTLEALQEIVGGYIEVFRAEKDLLVICNEEGRINALPFNTRIAGEFFFGNIILCGIDGEDFDDIPGKYLEVNWRRIPW